MVSSLRVVSNFRPFGDFRRVYHFAPHTEIAVTPSLKYGETNPRIAVLLLRKFLGNREHGTFSSSIVHWNVQQTTT